MLPAYQDFPGVASPSPNRGHMAQGTGLRSRLHGSALLLLLPAALLLGTSGISLLPEPGLMRIAAPIPKDFPQLFSKKRSLICITMYNGWFLKLLL